MSTLQVANIAFEATDNNQIQYVSNTVKFIIGAANSIFYGNSSIINITFANTPSIITASNDALTYTSNVMTQTLTTNGQILFIGNVSPTILSVDVSDWDAGIANAYFVRLSSNAAVNIYGMKAGFDGQVVVLNNIGNNAVTLVTENATNQANAINRFSLPNNITLYPSSSISLIYDGNTDRWRGQHTIGTDYTYKNQLVKGFFSGGSATPITYATACRTTYSTETTTAVVGANLTQAKLNPGAAGNSVSGFFAGGNAGCIVATACRTTYSTESTAASPTSSLSQARSGLTAFGTSCKGFFAGGNAPTQVATADRMTYATATAAAIAGANLSLARNNLAGAGNSCKGFAAGGTTGTISAVTDRTTYSTETTAAVPGANLSTGRSTIRASGTACKGFFSGGVTAPACSRTTTADRLTYATETISVVTSAALSTARGGVGTAGNVCKAFFNGGNLCTAVTTSDRTTYSTETTAAVPGANLTQARNALAAI